MPSITTSLQNFLAVFYAHRSLLSCLTIVGAISLGLFGVACVPATSLEQVSSAEEVEAESHRRTVEAYRQLLAQKLALEKVSTRAEGQLEKEKSKSSHLSAEKKKAEQEVAQVKVAEAKAEAAHKEVRGELSRSSSELAKSQSEALALKAEISAEKASLQQVREELANAQRVAQVQLDELKRELSEARQEVKDLKEKQARAKAQPNLAPSVP